MIRGLMYAFDRLAIDYRDLLNRQHIEEAALRQFFRKDGALIQITTPVPYQITDESPLEPYGEALAVKETKNASLPDLSPLNCLAYLYDKNIYVNSNSFSIERTKSILPMQSVHTCFEFDNSLTEKYVNNYPGRSLILAFGQCLAQARLKFGNDVSGVLPEPITIHFVNTNGRKFHFSVFQLNTLDLEGETKNIFWHDPEIKDLYETCAYINAVPTLEGYDHDVFRTLLAMYLQNAV